MSSNKVTPLSVNKKKQPASVWSLNKFSSRKMVVVDLFLGEVVKANNRWELLLKKVRSAERIVNWCLQVSISLVKNNNKTDDTEKKVEFDKEWS